MQKLNSFIDNIENKLAYYQKADPAVSTSTVGWHMEHTLLVIIKITAALKQSEPENYRWKFNINRSIVYAFNTIPRGRGKAPQTVQPTAGIDREHLTKTILAARERVLMLETLPANAHFSHPYFGMLNIEATIRFLKIHTKHHLKIMDDIVRSKVVSN